MMLLYLTSTLYHALPEGHAKRLILKFGLGTIYFFIAGSYTPFALGGYMGFWDSTLFGLIWILALLGATLKAFDRLSHPWLSTGLYLVMGWLVLIAVVPHFESFPLPSIELLMVGGLTYTAGVAFYMLDSKFPFAHTVWHCFVVAGTACHYFAVLSYAA